MDSSNLAVLCVVAGVGAMIFLKIVANEVAVRLQIVEMRRSSMEQASAKAAAEEGGAPADGSSEAPTTLERV